MLPNWFEEVCYHSFLSCHIHMNMVALDMTKRSGSSCRLATQKLGNIRPGLM